MTFSSIRQSFCFRLISLCLMITFITTMVITPKARAALGATPYDTKKQGILGLPQPGTMVNLSPAYVPLMITGLTVHPENPLLMDFIVSTGDSGLNAQQVKKESDRLIKYFLACLTIPENDQWVNLSPYEKQRIVPEDLGQTVLGQDMLAQDYILKQLTASLIYPEKNLGKNFWDQVYAKASQMYGTTQIPVNTFNKVWILPEYAKVFEHKDTVFVVKSHLKVMLDEDYLALQKQTSNSPSTKLNSPLFYKEGLGEFRGSSKNINTLGSQVIRQIILPAIEKEVNTGKNFAQLRQIYNSMILAVWFKKNLKEALLNQVYTDKSKVNGVNADDPDIKEKIYQQYLQAYKKGVFNYIKEETDQTTQQTIPRKYFSGGLVAPNAAMLSKATLRQVEDVLENEPEGDKEYRIDGLGVEIPGLTQEASISNQVSIAASSSTADGDDGFNPFRPDSAMTSLDEHPTALAHFIKPIGEIKRVNRKDLKSRTIKFGYDLPDGEKKLFTLESTFTKGTTIHRFSGYGITPIIVTEELKGDQTEENWQSILVHLEYTVNPHTGIPYRDGILEGNAYEKNMTSDEVKSQIKTYETEGAKREALSASELDSFTEARLYTSGKYPGRRKEFDNTKVQKVNSQGKTTFGIAIIEDRGRKTIVIETGFLDRIKEENSPYHLLEMAFVHILYQGTHEQNCVEEFEYVRFKDGELLKNLPRDVVKVRDNLMAYVKPNLDKTKYDVAREWERKITESLWEMGLNEIKMYGTGKKIPRVRWSKQDPEFADEEDTSGEVSIGLYGSALNPLHFGQFEAVLRAMAQEKMTQVGVVVHAFDFRKQKKGLNPTFPERDEMAEEWVALFDGFLTIAGVFNGSEADGETKFEELMKLNAKRKGKTTFVYTAVGGDHDHLWAPGGKDANGYRTPIILNGPINGLELGLDLAIELTRTKERILSSLDKTGSRVVLNKDIDLEDREILDTIKRVTESNGGNFENVLKMLKDSRKPQPDTVTKMLNIEKRIKEYLREHGMDENKFKIVVAFNYRELYESLPMPVEVDELNKLLEEGFLSPLGHINLFDTSSTNIRLYYSGDKTQDISFLPHMIAEYTRTHGRYRGWIIGLPDAIKRLASYKSVDLWEGTTLLERFSGTNFKEINREVEGNEKGNLVDPANPDSVWLHVSLLSGSPAKLILKPNINLSRDDVKKYVDKNDVDRFWAIVQEVQDVRLFQNWYMDERKNGVSPTSESIARDFSFTEEQLLSTFKFTQGSIEAAEKANNVSFRGDVIDISNKEAQKVLDGLSSLNAAMTAVEHKNITIDQLSSLVKQDLTISPKLGLYHNDDEIIFGTINSIDRVLQQLAGDNPQALFNYIKRNNRVEIYDAAMTIDVAKERSLAWFNSGWKDAESNGNRPLIVEFNDRGKEEFEKAFPIINNTSLEDIRDNVFGSNQLSRSDAAGYEYVWRLNTSATETKLVLSRNKLGAEDHAVLTSKPVLQNVVSPGGIDLNSRNLNLQSEGQKVNITFDPAMIAQFKRGDFSGVKIQIIDVVPINLMPLLGLKEDEGQEQLAKV